MLSKIKEALNTDMQIKFNAASHLSPAQQWVVYVGALIGVKDGMEMNTVRTGRDDDIVRDGLNGAWGVNNRQEMLQTAQRLAQLGNTAEYELYWKELLELYLPRNQKKPEGLGGKLLGLLSRYTEMMGAPNMGRLIAATGNLNGKVSDDTEEIGKKLQAGANWVEMLSEYEIDAYSVKSMKIWDASRLINLARGGHQLGWIDESEFFQLCTPVAQQIQAAYSSWKDLINATAVASLIWNYDEDRMEEAMEAHMLLARYNKSPLLSLPWNTPLAI